MLYPLKAVINKNVLRDRTSAIYFQYCYSSTKRTLLNTEITIPAEFWYKKRQCITKSLPRTFGDYQALNKELSRIRHIIERIIDYGLSIEVDNIGAFVKETFKPDFDVEKLKKGDGISLSLQEPDFFVQIDDYIKSKEKKVVSTAVFKAMKDRLLQFQTHTKTKIKFSSLDYNFYLDFVEFLTFEYRLKRKLEFEYGLKLSTIGSTIKNLRVFVNDGVT